MTFDDVCEWIRCSSSGVLVEVLDELFVELTGRGHRVEGLLVEQAKLMLQTNLAGKPLPGSRSGR